MASSRLILRHLSVLMLVILSIASVGGHEFVVRPHNISAVEDQTAMLECVIRYIQGQVVWSKGGVILGGREGQDNWSHPRYSLHPVNNYATHETYTANLKIDPVKLEDDDVYICQVFPSGDKEPIAARAWLSVQVMSQPPVILNYHNGSVLEVPFGRDSIDLVCEARDGRPAAMIFWYHNGVKVSNHITSEVIQPRESKLITTRSTLRVHITDRARQNKDTYRCEAAHTAALRSQPSTQVTLNILYPPGKPEISGYDNHRVLQVNESIVLRCTSRGGNPTATVRWYRGLEGTKDAADFSYISSNGDSGIATNEFTHRVNESDNGETYRCRVGSDGEGMQSHAEEANYTLKVSFPPKSVTVTGAKEPVKTGHSVTLKCKTAPANPAANVTWYKEDELQRNVRTEHSGLSTDGGYITTSWLTFEAKASLHNSVFTCQANGGRVSDSQTLNVIYPPNPPRIQGYMSGRQLVSGKNHTLRCRATGGNPVAVLKWFKGSRLLTDASYYPGPTATMASSELVIPLQPSDNGAVYKCKASNSATQTSLVAQVTLAVDFPPSRVSISTDPASGQVKAGQTVRLTCVSSSSNPPAVITWSRDTQRVSGTGIDLGREASTNGGSKTTNRIEFRASPRDNGAVFGCRATNQRLGTDTSDAVTLDVLFKPEFDTATLPTEWELKRGQHGSMNITTKANPVDVSYSIHRTDLRPTQLHSVPQHFYLSDGILNISQVEKSDTGHYMVKATNREGTSTYNFSLVVKYAAKVHSVSEAQSLDEGVTVTFRCEADAHPVVPNMFTWYRSGFDLSRFSTKQSGNVSTLTIRHLRREDSGNFTCNVDNRIGLPDSKDVSLVVKFSPVIDKSPEYSRSAGRTGNDVTLRCEASGAPAVSITWTRNNTQVQPNKKFNITTSEKPPNYKSVLKVKSMTHNDYGAYVCTATNNKGSDSHSITLAGTTKPYPPYNIQVVNRTARSITLAWKGGFNGGLAQSFRVRYKPMDARGYVYLDVSPFGALSYKITGLELDTNYELTVLAFNDLGESAYQARGITARTLDKEVPADVATSELQGSDETPVIIILVVCIVGVFILTLNVGLILFFIRKRKKRLEGASDTGSHTNNFELYGSANKDHNLYPAPPSDDTRSYGTYDKSMDDFSDDYIREYDRECETHVFLPPIQSDYPGSRPYSPTQKLAPCESPRLLGGGSKIVTYIGEDRTGRISPWQEEPTYKRAQPPGHKKNYENGVPNGDVYEFKSARGKGMNELSERPSSRPPSRTGSSSILSPNIVANPNFNSGGGGGISSFSNGGPKTYSSSLASINRPGQHHRSGNNISSSGNLASSTRTTSPTHQNMYNSRQSPSSVLRPSPSPHNTVPAGSEFRGHLV